MQYRRSMSTLVRVLRFRDSAHEGGMSFRRPNLLAAGVYAAKTPGMQGHTKSKNKRDDQEAQKHEIKKTRPVKRIIRKAFARQNLSNLQHVGKIEHVITVRHHLPCARHLPASCHHRR